MLYCKQHGMFSNTARRGNLIDDMVLQGDCEVAKMDLLSAKEYCVPKLTDIRKQALDGMMKEALFEATVAVLNRHGVDGMTMERVAAEAGIAKGSLYRYFASKRELVEFVFAKTIDPIFESIDNVVASTQPAIDKLVTQLYALLDHVAKHAQVHRLLFEDETAHGILQSSERRTAEVAGRQMANIFRQGIEEGVFRPEDPLMLANMYIGLCKGILQGEPGLENPEQREKIHRLILSTFLNGIATQKGRVG
jgi:AcrR family transcriptional regulator